MTVSGSYPAFRIESQDIEGSTETYLADIADSVVLSRDILEVDFSYISELHPVFTKIQGPVREASAKRGCVVPVTGFMGISSRHNARSSGSAEGGIRIGASKPGPVLRETVQVRSPGDGAAAAHVIGVVLVGDYDYDVHESLE